MYNQLNSEKNVTEKGYNFMWFSNYYCDFCMKSDARKSIFVKKAITSSKNTPSVTHNSAVGLSEYNYNIITYSIEIFAWCCARD